MRCPLGLRQQKANHRPTGLRQLSLKPKNSRIPSAKIGLNSRIPRNSRIPKPCVIPQLDPMISS
ncbi:MAG: hypothetical protein SOZ73_02850 [Campylobacter sp.]|nr:hypothetical protein [Campylobacter sp.]